MSVIPAEAGIHSFPCQAPPSLDPCFRRDDELEVASLKDGFAVKWLFGIAKPENFRDLHECHSGEGRNPVPVSLEG